jgi:hypothetical protein
MEEVKRRLQKIMMKVFSLNIEEVTLQEVQGALASDKGSLSAPGRESQIR